MADEAQIIDRISKALAQTGERERLKTLLKSKLVEIGWHERVRAECEAEIRRRGIDSIGAQEIVDYTTERARALVPESVRQELLQQIEQFIDSSNLI